MQAIGFGIAVALAAAGMCLSPRHGAAQLSAAEAPADAAACAEAGVRAGRGGDVNAM